MEGNSIYQNNHSVQFAIDFLLLPVEVISSLCHISIVDGFLIPNLGHFILNQ